MLIFSHLSSQSEPAEDFSNLNCSWADLFLASTFFFLSNLACKPSTSFVAKSTVPSNCWNKQVAKVLFRHWFFFFFAKTKDQVLLTCVACECSFASDFMCCDTRYCCSSLSTRVLTKFFLVSTNLLVVSSKFCSVSSNFSLVMLNSSCTWEIENKNNLARTSNRKNAETQIV